MGEAEIDGSMKIVRIYSHLVCYGAAASSLLAGQIAEEIESMWNAPRGEVELQQQTFQVQFQVTAEYRHEVTEMEVLQSTNPRLNYFRIEDFVHGSISFVDGVGCNTGYFLLENLYEGSTTAAHEYGHTLGLPHPQNLDLRGNGTPGIMYPRGTLVDPQFQYDPLVPAGQKGGTLHPRHRKVQQQDILNLNLHRLSYVHQKARIGEFTNVYHWSHRETGPEEFYAPPVVG